MSELDAALAVEPKQPVRTERNFALTKGIAGAVRCGTQARCPFRGQKATWGRLCRMSVPPLRADVVRPLLDVRKVPSTEGRRMVRPRFHTSDALRGPLPLGQTHTILEPHRYTAQLLDESD